MDNRRKLIVHGLTKKFNRSLEGVKVLDNLSFEINREEIVSILAPNGYGKTTLIKIMCGLLRPDRGYVEINGENIFNHAGVKKNIGVSIDGSKDSYSNFTAKENIKYFGMLMGLSNVDIGIRLEKISKYLNIESIFNVRTSKLSRGQRQKLSIVLGILHNPQYLILDEPTLGLDLKSSQTLSDMLLDMKNDGIGIFLASHDTNIISKISDRIIFLKNGKVETTLDGCNLSHDGQELEKVYLNVYDEK